MKGTFALVALVVTSGTKGKEMWALLLPYDEISTNRGRSGKAPIPNGVCFSATKVGSVNVPCDEPDFQEQEKQRRQIPQMLFTYCRLRVFSLQPLTRIDFRRDCPAPVKGGLRC